MAHVLVVPFPGQGHMNPMADGAGANLLNPEDACIKWLDTKAPTSGAYVSFGSIIASLRAS
nr:unnamed protein product [Digitaria exilis]